MSSLLEVLNVQTVGLLAGLLYTVLPLGVWFILKPQDEVQQLRMWCGGNMLIGLFVLIGIIGRAHFSHWQWLAGFGGGILGVMLRTGALHRQIGEFMAWRWLLLAWSALVVLLEIIGQFGLGYQLGFAGLLHVLGCGWVAHAAWRVGRRVGSRSADAMAVAYALAAVALLVRSVHLLQAVPSAVDATAITQTSHSLVLTLLAMLTGIFGNIAYIGITLERVRAREVVRTLEALQASQAQRESQAQSERLRTLLRERDEMLHLLAHEVRQPLNNASAALQSAQTEAAKVEADLAPRLVGRLDRAQGVIQQITSILDNTLAATTLLSADSQLAPIEADLESLVALCLADIAPPARLRVLVEHDPGLRTAAFDPGLMRLALRNLLVNALAYSPAGSSVVLRLSECEEPLAIVFEVSDQGRGIDEAFRERVFERGVRGAQTLPAGLGLGLYIVRRVAELHQGTVQIMSTRPGNPGACLRLTIPQGSPV